MPFAFDDSYSPMSLCLTGNSLFIDLCYFDSKNSRTIFRHMSSFNVAGIMSSTWDLSALNINGSLVSVININEKEIIFCTYAEITRESTTYQQHI